ncbi:hypothetical protein, partial [Treponema paraluiscuniculi]|uniref:hypothetical protein n=1 Tax=Treponema paraluiscuniculi TaxID=53435 RepID=UPI002FDBD0AD
MGSYGLLTFLALFSLVHELMHLFPSGGALFLLRLQRAHCRVYADRNSRPHAVGYYALERFIY